MKHETYSACKQERLKRVVHVPSSFRSRKRRLTLTFRDWPGNVIIEVSRSIGTTIELIWGLAPFNQLSLTG